MVTLRAGAANNRLAATLLLTYAVRNADCHAKNLALLYPAGNDVHPSPAYDFLTTTVYASYQHNPPGIGFMGKKTWTPGQTLSWFITGTFGILLREQTLLVQAIRDAVSDVVPLVQNKIAEHADFWDIGKRMLLAWQDGVQGLREKLVYASGDWPGEKAFEGISDASKLATPSTAVGRSPLQLQSVEIAGGTSSQTNFSNCPRSSVHRSGTIYIAF